MTVEEREQKAGELFKAGYNCCQAVAMTFADVIGLPEDEIARLASGFGGGMGRMREVCGTVSAMTMVAGAMIPANDVNDKAAKTANYALVQEMAGEFKQLNGSIICRELLGLSKPEGTPVPSDRNQEYYKKRPCGELCLLAAGIIARKLKIENYMRRGIFILLMAVFGAKAFACTNLIVTKGASANGSNMCTYAADSHQLYGTLHYSAAADYPAGAMREIVDWDSGKKLGEIPQAAHVYSVIGNMNEHQLVIGETTYGGREFIDSTAILDYGSLIYIALERCKTAREAILLIDKLVQQYGYASEGESFTLCDPNEIWIMEIIGKNPKFDKKGRNVNKGAVWVAKRIPDGYISGHANQSRITTIDFNDPDNCLYAKDVIKHAREQGIFSGKDEEFSFCDVYNPLDFGGARGCEARVWSYFNRFADGMDEYLDYAMGYDLKNHMPLYVKPNRKISTKDLADMMRDHYEGTPMDMTTDIGAGGSHLPYRWRPMEFEYQGWEYVNERAIATQQTGWWYVAQSRPDKKNGIFWFGVDDAGTSPLMPFFSCTNSVPECLRDGNGSLLEYSETSMYWIVSRIAQFAYLRYDKIGAEVRDIIDKYETEMIAKADAMSDSESVQKLSSFGVDNAVALFKRWQNLDKYLLVKYIDGNIKRQNEDGTFVTNGYSDQIPEYPIWEDYSDKWKENVVRDNGDVLRIRK